MGDSKRVYIFYQKYDSNIHPRGWQEQRKGSGTMSGTKLMLNWVLANTHLGTIKINTQFSCHPHWELVNTQFGNLTPNLVAHQFAHHSHGFLSFSSISSTSTAIHSPLSA